MQRRINGTAIASGFAAFDLLPVRCSEKLSYSICTYILLLLPTCNSHKNIKFTGSLEHAKFSHKKVSLLDLRS